MDRSQGNRMTSVEIQAYSVEEAIRLALEQLALPQEAVDIEVLSDAGPDEDAEALVRVTAKGMASQPTPSERPSGRRKGRPSRVTTAACGGPHASTHSPSKTSCSKPSASTTRANSTSAGLSS